MFRLVIFSITLILITLSRVVLSDFGDNNDLDSESPEFFYENNFGDYKNNEKIWVLELNDEAFDSLKLRSANEEDKEDFEFYTEPLVKNYYREHGKVVKKDAPKPAKAEILDKKKATTKTSKEDIFKYLNKYALFSKTESDGYISDSHADDESSIALHFYDRFTSIIVKQGIRQWHYFIAPPSILPAWFYEDLPLNSEDVVSVPEDVTEKFYPALFRLLQALLRYPV